jgi:hypothetical protein
MFDLLANAATSRLAGGCGTRRDLDERGAERTLAICSRESPWRAAHDAEVAVTAQYAPHLRLQDIG